MAQYVEDMDLAVVENDTEPRSGGLLGKIIALLLGVVLGVVATLGGIAGVGYYLVNRPVNQLANIASKFGYDIDISEYLRDEYAQKKVLDLLDNVGTAATDFKDGKGTLASLDAISPKVGELVGELTDRANKVAIPLEKDVLMTKKLSEMKDYLGDSLSATPVGDCLLALGKPLAPMMEALCYGERGVDYYIDEEGKAVMIDGAHKTIVSDLINTDMTPIVGRIPVETVIEVSPTDTVMCAIAYGPSSHYTVIGDTVVMNQVVYFTEDGKTFTDDLGETVDYTAVTTFENEDGYQLDFKTDKTNEDGTPIYETQYLYRSNDETGEYLAYYDLEKTKPVNYKKTKINDLQQDAMSIIDSVLLKDALNVDETSHGILRSLAYGEEGIAYTFNSAGKIQMNTGYAPRTIGELRTRGEDLINDIYLKEIMDTKPDDAITMFLLYGKEGIHYELDNDKNVIMKRQTIAIADNGAVYNEYGEKMSDDSYDLDVNAKTYSVRKNGKIFTYKYEAAQDVDPVTTVDGPVAVYYLYDTVTNAPVDYKATTLGDLAGGDNVISNITKRLTIGEVLDEDTVNGNRFFKHVKDETVESLPAAIEKLTIQQVFADSVYKTDADGNFIDKDGNITTNHDEYVLEGSWWYLLTSYNKETGVNEEHEYSLNEMNQLITNMKENVHNATIRKLQADGMINNLDPNTLNSEVRPKIGNYDMTAKLDAKDIPYGTEENPVLMGDLTVEQMMNYVNVIFGALSELGL